MLLHCLESSQSRAVFDSICSGSSLGFLFTKPNLITTDFQVGQSKCSIHIISIICTNQKQIPVVGLVIIKIGRINLVVLFGAAFNRVAIASIKNCICCTAINQIDGVSTESVACLAVCADFNGTGIVRHICNGVQVERKESIGFTAIHIQFVVRTQCQVLIDILSRIQ